MDELEKLAISLELTKAVLQVVIATHPNQRLLRELLSRAFAQAQLSGIQYRGATASDLEFVRQEMAVFLSWLPSDEHPPTPTDG